MQGLVGAALTGAVQVGRSSATAVAMPWQGAWVAGSRLPDQHPAGPAELRWRQTWQQHCAGTKRHTAEAAALE